MKELGHLQVYDLILRTRTPLFVGSGKKYVKKEYLFDPKSKCSCTVEKQKEKQRHPALPLFRSQENAIEKFIAVCYT